MTTRSMFKAIKDFDIKPEIDVVYRRSDEQNTAAKFSQAQTFKPMGERMVDGKVLGAESDLSHFNSIKKEPEDMNSKRTVCMHQILMNLAKP